MRRPLSQSRRASCSNFRASNDRLNQLSLPNSHLVEAVLKEHYGIFNEECKTRLKKLLEIIVHNGAERKTEKMDDRMKVKCITNLRRRIKCIENEEKKRHEFSLFRGSCNNNCGDQVRKKESREMHVLYQSEHSKSQLTIPTEGGDCNTDCGECNTEIGECNTDIADLNSEAESYKTALEMRQDTFNHAHRMRKEYQNMPIRSPLTDDEEHILRQHFSKGDENLPTLVIRYYIILILDMKKNCSLYDVFIKQVLRPTETYKMQYFEKGYNLWMEYLVYIKTTLDTLHPYILQTIKMCKQYQPGDINLKQIETRIPTILVAALRRMKSWRKSLQETIKCCRDLLAENGHHRTPAVNAHRMYLRYRDYKSTISQLNLQVDKLLLDS